MKPGRSFIAASVLLSIALAVATVGQTRMSPTDDSRGTRTGRGRKHRKHAKVRTKTDAPDAPSGATITPTGLVYVITQHGSGRQPRAGETVIVNYTGLLGSGVKFDSSLDHGKPFEFPLGAGRVIKGWDEGIAKLHVGDQATLIIPPALGYGAKGAGGIIPPDATLIFLVELVGIKEAPAPN